MPAVLDRPLAFRAEPVGPPDDLEVIIARGRRGGLAADLTADVVDRDNCMGALVRVDTEGDHGALVAFHVGDPDQNRSVGTPQWGRSHAPIKPRRPVLQVRGPAESMLPTKRGTEATSQAPRRRPE
jgi:hypothetical protein